jgi:hypothetical protein
MRLPVSGLDVSFRLPNGHDDLAILEASGASRTSSIERALEALCRLATLSSAPSTSSDPSYSNPNPSPWLCLTITDFECALLGLRRFLFGDIVRTLVRCTCSERMEMEFSITTLLREACPRTPRRLVPSTHRAGWFLLPEKSLTFRLPTLSDQLQALASPSPFAELEHNCIERTVDAAAIQSTSAAERAMEAMAPTISRPVTGVCAECGTSLIVQLYVPSLVLNELQSSASNVHTEIHAIAANYHWHESAILALPQIRRHAYTEAIRNGGTL